MNIYNLFKTDESLSEPICGSVFKTGEQTDVGVMIRNLKQSILSTQMVKQSFVNVLSSIIDDLDGSALLGDASDRVINPGDDMYDLYDIALMDIWRYFDYYGTERLGAPYWSHKCLNFTSSAGDVFVLGAYYSELPGYWDGIRFSNFTNEQPLGQQINLIYKDPDGDIHIHPTIVSINGRTIYLTDLLNDLIDSIEIQSVMHDAIQVSNSNTYSLTDILSQYSMTGNADTKQLINTLISAASGSGIIGVLNTIQGVYSSGADIQQSDEGLIEYVDYQAWMPKSFLAGIVSGLVTTVSSAISLILASIQPVIGAVAFCITGMVNFLYKVFNNQYNVKARLDSTQDAIPAFVIPIIAKPVVNGELYNANKLQYKDPIFNNNLPMLINTCGAWHVLSSVKDPSDPNSAISRVNGFIDLVDRRSLFTGLVQYYVWQTGGSGIHLTYHEYKLLDTGVQTLVDHINNHGDNNLSSFKPSDDYHDGLSSRDDITARLIICTNLIYHIITHTKFNANAANFSPVSPSSTGDNSYYFDCIGRMWYDDFDGYTGTEFHNLASVLGSTLKYLYDGSIPDANVPSWKEISEAIESLQKHGLVHYGLLDPSSDVRFYSNYVTVYTDAILDGANFFGILEDEFSLSLKPAEYDQKEIIASLALIGAAVVATTVTAVVVSVQAKHAIQKKRAKLAANVEKTHNDFINDPTSDDKYEAYRSAVQRNNLSTYLFGGTKYSKVNYWDSTGSPDGDTNIISKIKNKLQLSIEAYEPTISTVIKLIKG